MNLKSQRTLNTRNTKKITCRHIKIKLLKTSDKENILKGSQREKSTLKDKTANIWKLNNTKGELESILN